MRLAHGSIGALVACFAMGCEAAAPEPAPPVAVDCGAPNSTPATPLPPGTPDIPGSTVWYEIPNWVWTLRAFDLDHRVRCKGGGGCLTSLPSSLFEKEGGDDAFGDLLSDFLHMCTGVKSPTHRVLLRLDGLGEGDDPQVRASLYPQHLDPVRGWVVDSDALEDGASLDRPRFRLADGFVRKGRFWSIGPATTAVPLHLTRCVESMSVDVPVRPHLFTLTLESGHGTLGGVVNVTDAAAALADVVRVRAQCSDYAMLAPWLAGDVVAASVTAANDGVDCDAQSASFDFFATTLAEPPAAVGAWVPPPRLPQDACLSQAGHTTPPCPALGCRSVDRGPDGHIYATAAYVWPDRAPEPPLPDDTELAVACATLATCLPLDDITGVSSWDWSGIETGRADFAKTCASGESIPESHAFPLFGSSTRLGALMPIALRAKGDCSQVLAARKGFASLVCSEQGCGLTSSLGDVTCVGDDAHFASGAIRHCPEAFARCSASSPTGCTDRLPIRCSTSLDRCDGNVLLGCDEHQRVTFRDCGRYGGACIEISGRARCTPTGCTDAPTCSGNVLTLCTRGSNQLVDCTAIGFAGCVHGRCVP